jgi:hypothetical protein
VAKVNVKRGILVDVAALNVREVEFSGLSDMYRLIDCDMVECVSVDAKTDRWVDEEGLLKNDGKGWAVFKGAHSPLKGNVLITGGCDRHGNTMATKMTLEEAASKTTFALRT